MKRLLACCLLLIAFVDSYSQKKPLDHSVYDSWQHIGERMISNDGKWVVYTIDPQEGDNELVIQSSDAKYKKTIPRGYNAVITEDSRYVIFKIKPIFKDTREAKIKKKKPDDFPKDSLAIIEFGKEEIWKSAKVKSYKTPQKSFGWVAYQLEKSPATAAKPKSSEIKVLSNSTDSLKKVIDSLENLIESIPPKIRKKLNWDESDEDVNYFDADGDDALTGAVDSGSDLVLRNLLSGEEKIFNNVLEYFFSKTGGWLLIKQAKDPKDSLSKLTVSYYNLSDGKSVVLGRGGNDFKNFAMTDDGSQVAYVAERDAKPKDLQKFYKLWYYKNGMDSATLLADKFSVGMKLGMTISEFGNLNFSKSGKRLFFGSAPIQPPKDTALVDFENAKLDIWHYKDDYLQTVQLNPNRLRAAQQENFLTVYDLETKTIRQLGSEEIPQVMQTNEGDGDTFVGVSDFGKRVEGQWLGITRKDIYAIDVNSGQKKKVKENLFGTVYPSSTGKYIMWYDRKARNYFAWDGTTTRNITEKIKVPLYNEEYDQPEEPTNYGVMKWEENDENVFIYDRYDIWKINIKTSVSPECLTNGRKIKIRYRYIQTDPEERFLYNRRSFLVKLFDETDKSSGLGDWMTDIHLNSSVQVRFKEKSDIGNVLMSKQSAVILLTKETFQNSPNLYTNAEPESTLPDGRPGLLSLYCNRQLSSINPQQSNYLWGTAELFKWKAYNGKDATGIVYKPENFDPKKKYPMICYFYEKLSDGLFDYKEPAPIRSSMNIPYFVSNGYIVFLPDIEYKVGYPGKSSFDYIVSGSRALVKKGWVDSTNMALQGHSWGGYQAAQVATMTKLFKAVWAGAPVANMTSAYGGIRWESGISRQWQYEKAQSRIGGTLWEKLPLYLENSPLFHLNKVTAPMVIMANDADGAVPWYQGIEMFSALRRLGKKAWMLNYNGQGHGLSQRQDMKDYQIRMQQFFDWILKGEKPAKWITEGVPAVKKGKEWGLEIVD